MKKRRAHIPIALDGFNSETIRSKVFIQCVRFKELVGGNCLGLYRRLSGFQCPTSKNQTDRSQGGAFDLSSASLQFDRLRVQPYR
jgi:hypothetical protein